MVALPTAVNIDDIPERDDYTPLPPNSYTGMIVGSEMKPTKDNMGEMLVLEIDIVEGEYAGRKLFERLNLRNANEKAVEIAYKTLGEISRACGRQGIIKDSSELHNKRFQMDVVIEPGKPYMKDGAQVEGKPQNRIKKYHALGSGQASAQAAPASGATSARPWARK